MAIEIAGRDKTQEQSATVLQSVVAIASVH
jgi:Tfp pilus assembly protein PilX